ncbi:hypothetical protein [Teredinibacter turnerae]|uniref:hypothetical protein n=1 Tax=Teredinibacter turnerae TaxID=2426 RepID=UPI00037E4908|nr:hypothetical protein [Teredinibacter turnerae]
MKIVSLGAGVQSTVMSLMAECGEIERPDAAIFADTGNEPVAVYGHLEWLVTQLSYPVYRVSAGNIAEDIKNGCNSVGTRYVAMPFFLSNGGMGRRQCTSEYKIRPIVKKVRELCGLKSGERAAGKVFVEQWIGITTDEIVRMKSAREKWITNRWPLIELNMSRSDCIAWFGRKYPGRQLVKSSCKMCPYHSDDEWRGLSRDEFREACEFDDAIRVHPDMRNDQYVHAARIPLRDVDLRVPGDFGQLSFLDECDGLCGL